jgi:hypothetical protein
VTKVLLYANDVAAENETVAYVLYQYAPYNTFNTGHITFFYNMKANKIL